MSELKLKRLTSLLVEGQALEGLPTERPSSAALERDQANGSSPGTDDRETTAGVVLTASVDDADQASTSPAVTAFQAAVGEARQEAQTRLKVAVERVQQAAAERHAAELAEVNKRHAEEFQQVRDNAQAEVTAAIEQVQQEIRRIRQEEADRHAVELTRVREALQSQHDEDLRQARTAVVESFETLTGSLVPPGIAQDVAEAVRWYRLAVDECRAEAQFNLGVISHKGDRVPQDYAEALHWYRLAADQGFAPAQHALGFMYHVGEGVQQDHAEAMQWYRLAADRNFVEAQSALASMHGKGEGVPRDRIAAHMWLRIAAESDDRYVAARDAVADQMTAEQITESSYLASAWQPAQPSSE